MGAQINAFILLAIVAVAYTSSVCPSTDSVESIYVPNLYDCSTFYQCSGGEAILLECPEGLEFNAELQVCDWPEKSGCEVIPISCPEVDGDYAVNIANPADCSTYYACERGTAILTECPPGLEFNAALQVCDWPASANCVVTA